MGPVRVGATGSERERERKREDRIAGQLVHQTRPIGYVVGQGAKIEDRLEG